MRVFRSEDTRHVAKPITPDSNAGFFRRLLALVYDALLMLGVIFAYAIIIMLPLLKLFGQDTTDRPTPMASALILLGVWLSCSAYYVWCWHKGGQTLAMKSWRMRLESLSGAPLTVQQCWWRCVVAPLCIAAGGIGLLWSLVHPRNMALQDILTGTRVRLLPKQRRKDQPAVATEESSAGPTQ